MNLDGLLKAARNAYDSMSPEEKLEHDAEQAASYAFHCAKEFRKKGGTYEEFMRKHGAYLKDLYKRRHATE